MNLKRYLRPACIVALVLGILLFFNGKSRRDYSSEHTPTQPSLIQEFHRLGPADRDRVLYIVVDEDGAYIGRDRFNVRTFADAFKVTVRDLKPDFIFVCGTDLVRFGDLVAVYDPVQKMYPETSTVGTKSLPVGTRIGPIIVRDHRWQYLDVLWAGSLSD
jgi:hypothetical protein